MPGMPRAALLTRLPRAAAPHRRSHAAAAAADGLPAPPPRAHPPPRLVLRGQPVPRETWENAAVLVDKPAGWTSFDVCAKLRGALRTKKIGHAGTLDPMATGLLIICTGRGTKWVDFFQAQVKGYTGCLRLGEATPSYDAETEVSERSTWEHVSDSALQSAASTFLGSISQVPPMYSALKQNGVPLYVKARAGVVVERAPRQLLIERFDVERSVAGGPDVRFAVTCSKGTYIRSLAHDLGAALGTHAHLTELRRVSIGDHAVDNAWPLDALIAAANAASAEATVV